MQKSKLKVEVEGSGRVKSALIRSLMLAMKLPRGEIGAEEYLDKQFAALRQLSRALGLPSIKRCAKVSAEVAATLDVDVKLNGRSVPSRAEKKKG